MSKLLFDILPKEKRELIFVYPDVKVSQCCELMSQHDIGALLVIDELNVIGEMNLVGIVSERDIVRRCLCTGLDSRKTVARDIAFADVTILTLHDTIETAMKAMTETRRRHILIKDKDEIMSILSIGDILYHLLEDKAHVIEQLENYIHTY